METDSKESVQGTKRFAYRAVHLAKRMPKVEMRLEKRVMRYEDESSPGRAVKDGVRGTVRRKHSARPRAWRAAALCLLSALVSLTGCAGFFSCDKASCPATTTTTPTTSTADYAYVAESSSTGSSITGYNVGGGALTAAGSLPLGYTPVALTVAPGNGFLYIASSPGATNPGVYLYTIGSNGALTASGTPVAPDAVASMAISPDGNWLYTISTTGQFMTEYTVDTGTGALTLKGQIAFQSLTACVPGAALPVTQSCTVAVSPKGDYVVASLGTGGDEVFAYTSAGGVGNLVSEIASGYPATPTGDYSNAVDGNDFAYIAQTNGLAVYSLGVTTTNAATFTYPAGTTPRGVTLSKSYNYVYTANEATGTISAFGIGTNGSLTTLTGSPYAGPANVSALGVDNTGAYMVAAGYDGTAGVRLYAIGATGILTQVAATGSGAATAYPTLVAMTH